MNDKSQSSVGTHFSLVWLDYHYTTDTYITVSAGEKN